MKIYLLNTVFIAAALISNSSPLSALPKKPVHPPVHKTATNLYIDVHHFGPGKVSFADVAKAHAKDVAIQKKQGVTFIKYWLDEKSGTVYCLSSAKSSRSVIVTHSRAHGLLPNEIYLVKAGVPAPTLHSGKLYLDIHQLGADKVTANDVAKAHQKDLATQKEFSVNFINYWVNTSDGVVMCLSQAPDSVAVIATHRAAHGLIPASIAEVRQGQ